MKNLIVYVWQDGGIPFGVFTSQDEADKCLAMVADNIKTTVQNLKLDLYVYYFKQNSFYQH